MVHQDKDWTWVWQVLAVTYMIVFLTIVQIYHKRWTLAGHMQLDAIKLRDVTRSGRNNVSPAMMAIFRLSFAVYVFIILGMAMSRPVAKLEKGKVSILGGTQVLATFTMWSWSLIGIYGLVTGTLSALDAAGLCIRDGIFADRLARACWAWFQILTGISILICLVVWCVLVPLMPALISFIPLSTHNLNVVFMFTEMWLNRMPFAQSHVIFALYYGSLYIIFSWFYCWFTATPGSPGVVFYFFMDWRKPIMLPGYTILIGVQYGSFSASRCLSDWIKKDITNQVLGSRDAARGISPDPLVTDQGTTLQGFA